MWWIAACADPDPEPNAITIPFGLEVAGEPLACGRSYPGIGAGRSDLEPLDGRFYVHDVVLVDSDGSEHPVAPTPDGAFQDDRVVLLDFEDGTAACQTGSPETHEAIDGTTSAVDPVAIRFVLGVPPDRNHLDAVTAEAPLDITGLWWSWSAGYKYARLDVRTPTNPSFYLHLGGTSCASGDDGAYACLHDNLASIEVPWSTRSAVVLDLATLYAENTLDGPADPEVDSVSGCMSFETDPECPPIFERLGITWEGVDVVQSAFAAVEP